MHELFTKPGNSRQGNDPDHLLSNLLNNNNLKCHYVFPDLHALTIIHTQSFDIIGFNINSIPEHFEEFTNLNLAPLHHSFDYICLCETKLSMTFKISTVYPNIITFMNRSRWTGGIAIYVARKHHAFLRNDLCQRELPRGPFHRNKSGGAKQHYGNGL